MAGEVKRVITGYERYVRNSILSPVDKASQVYCLSRNLPPKTYIETLKVSGKGNGAFRAMTQEAYREKLKKEKEEREGR